tara:strand:+ start:19 stop:1020 length:1002 start_codon:yes stop_codon:yes gene_type:complete
MSIKKVILITGSSGEIGKNLIDYFSQMDSNYILSLDLNPIDNPKKVHKHIIGSILDKKLMDDVFKEYTIDTVYHLAAMLSTKAEQNPLTANEVNVNGTLNLIDLCMKQIHRKKSEIKFFFPSSIAVYGLNKKENHPIKETEKLNPKTIYGINKLYCEKLGNYFSQNNYLSNDDSHNHFFDFRAIRFPGLISVNTMPTGGTSDYLPEMLHSAAQKNNYECFVDANSQLPFMVMPDAIEAIIKLMNCKKKNLTQSTYNISSFNPTVDEFYFEIKKYYNKFKISYNVNKDRQKMVSSWPSDVDRSKSFSDWLWSPKYNLEKSFSDYFVPHLEKIYK